MAVSAAGGLGASMTNAGPVWGGARTGDGSGAPAAGGPAWSWSRSRARNRMPAATIRPTVPATSDQRRAAGLRQFISPLRSANLPGVLFHSTHREADVIEKVVRPAQSSGHLKAI